jgi:hypothetical protein
MEKNYIQEMQRALNISEKQNLKNQMDKEIEMKIQIISAAYDSASTYINLIIFAGYAGTFTLWSFTKDYLPELATIIIALMVGISLFLFCGWEIYKMIYTSISLRRQTEIIFKGLPPDKFFEAMDISKKDAIKQSIKLYRYWVFVLFFCVTLGFGGALLMFYNFIANLTGLPLWPK